MGRFYLASEQMADETTHQVFQNPCYLSPKRIEDDKSEVVFVPYIFKWVAGVCVKTQITEYTLSQTQLHSIPLHLQLPSADTPSETFFTFFSS